MKHIVERKIRLGFLGCGKISEKHFEGLSQHSKNIEVIAVCDPSAERSESGALLMNAKAYTDISEMLLKEGLDIVTVATPNGMHPDHIMQVADHGIHVITEKPMALSLEDAKKVTSYCNEKEVQLFVVHQNRFNDTAQEIWKAYKAGRFGKIYMITSNVFWTRPQDYYDKDGAWHGSKDMDGGAFYTQASHYIDFMQWIADSEPVKVYANLKTLARKIETEDSGVVNIEWDNGILGGINMTMLTYPKNFEGSVTILGEKGTVKIGGTAMNKIECWVFADHNSHDEEVIKANYASASVYSSGHARFYENIINVFRDNDLPLISGADGLRSMQILDAIHRSNDSDAVIKI
jgi:UDP-N-acetyl-2-amino-2-deoxyglucuronate dehydrogenase